MQILENFNSKTFVRWLIIGGVLAFSLMAYRLAQTFPLFLWVGGTGALVLGLLALKNMTAALTLVLLTSATTGFTLATGRTDSDSGWFIDDRRFGGRLVLQNDDPGSKILFESLRRSTCR